jgi:hypothetical protein
VAEVGATHAMARPVLSARAVELERRVWELYEAAPPGSPEAAMFLSLAQLAVLVAELSKHVGEARPRERGLKIALRRRRADGTLVHVANVTSLRGLERKLARMWNESPRARGALVLVGPASERARFSGYVFAGRPIDYVET